MWHCATHIVDACSGAIPSPSWKRRKKTLAGSASVFLDSDLIAVVGDRPQALAGLRFALLPVMLVVPSRRVTSLLASPILCAIVVFGLDSLNARVDAAPIVERTFDQESSDPSSALVGLDRAADGPRGGRNNPHSEGRDVPIHVPEPATWILTGIGLGGLAASRARRRWAIGS
jgi:PEP-CTERM motif-containing protein